MSVHAGDWKRCLRPGCKWFSRQQTGEMCGNCHLPFRFGGEREPDAALDLRLLNRALERAKGEVVRIETRIAELTKIGGAK